MKRKADFHREDESSRRGDSNKKPTTPKNATNVVPAKDVAAVAESSFKRILDVFEQHKIQLDREFKQWLEAPCMYPSPHYQGPSECIVTDDPAAGKATLPCMADPALWWSYRWRLFANDGYQRAKKQQYFELFGDRLLSTICLMYLDSWGLPFVIINALHSFITSNANWDRWSSNIPDIEHFSVSSDAFEVLLAPFKNKPSIILLFSSCSSRSISNPCTIQD